MIRKILFIIGLLTIATLNHVYSQLNYSLKAETGYVKYFFRMVQVDPESDWKGYNLKEKDGFELAIINGVDLKNKLFAGIGIGYLNFKGVGGLSIFSDVEYVPCKTRLTPLINLKIGYTHIWNQYENGTGTPLGECNVGFNFRLTETLDVYAKSGFAFTQQSALIPIRIGLRM